MKLAIIGTAGRKDDGDKLNLSVWNNMKRTVYRFVKEKNIDHIISGGAAYADHLAVGLFNAHLVKKLELALPCEFDLELVKYKDTGIKDWRLNPGKTSNYYHKLFSDTCNIDSLAELKKAIEGGAEVKQDGGFMARNSLVARAELLIAFTYGSGVYVKDGGTADTVKKFIKHWGSNADAYHCDLHTMELFEQALI